MPEGLMGICLHSCNRDIEETDFSFILRTSGTSGCSKKALKESINLTYFKSTFKCLCTVRTICQRHLCINNMNRAKH